MKTRILLTVMLIFMSWQSVAMPHIEYEEDLDEVTAAVEAKEISPFIDLLAIIERDFNGRVIKVELEKDDDYSEDDIWIYEIKILDADRNVVKADFDAKTFRLLAIKGHKLERFFNQNR
ncbi:hypothetical protein FR932_18215 [Moritella marina ATCC 15381]|uniref:PepSY domain-containing protein n=1 Tax=Moritella marina ATCC 15381 TaxID=1202962 RepID=A0A5J6WT64_MORMI|nr:PepSY domain-containing protein [Moritella marina]QFI39612.1 hypothetical protein FR932_18215 [Moritella marina ATCC 15381]